MNKLEEQQEPDTGGTKQKGIRVTEAAQEVFAKRVEGFIEAIHLNGGVEELFLYLKKKGVLTSGSKLSAFKSEFKPKRRREGNGIFKNPALIGDMLEFAKYPAAVLFGGPKAGPENMEIIEHILERTFIKAMNSADKNKHKSRTITSQIPNQVINIRRIIQQIIMNNYSYPDPVVQLFVNYSSKDKTWHHENEQRIKKILETLLEGPKSSVYAYYAAERWPFSWGSQKKLSENEISVDTYWNRCLIIAYQLYAIRKLYALHQAQKRIKIKGTQTSPPTIHAFRIKYEDTLGVDGQDVFATEFGNFCNLFDDMVKDCIEDPRKIETINPDSLNPIINNHQAVMAFLLSPYQARDEVDPSTHGSIINNFITREINIIKIFELAITQKEIKLLKENNAILTSVINTNKSPGWGWQPVELADEDDMAPLKNILPVNEIPNDPQRSKTKEQGVVYDTKQSSDSPSFPSCPPFPPSPAPDISNIKKTVMSKHQTELIKGKRDTSLEMQSSTGAVPGIDNTQKKGKKVIVVKKGKIQTIEK
jgi:hypothetical protein